MFRGFSVTEIGASHKEVARPCQDCSGHRDGPDFAIAAVSDGHGGEKYFRSGIGARIAVDVSLQSIEEFLKASKTLFLGGRDKDREKLILDLKRHIIAQWRTETEKFHRQHPLLYDELLLCMKLGIPTFGYHPFFYGATLLAACITKSFSFAIQLGDGKCLFCDFQDHVDFPVVNDERLGFGLTTSLCDENAIGEFKHAVYLLDPHAPFPGIQAIFLATDGFSDSYSEESLTMFCRKLLSQLQVDYEGTVSELKAWLPILSARGSRDDVSISGVFYEEEVVM